jgi:hypothetical protein
VVGSSQRIKRQTKILFELLDLIVVQVITVESHVPTKRTAVDDPLEGRGLLAVVEVVRESRGCEGAAGMATIFVARAT